MTLEEALDRLDRANRYIASLRDQIDRERREMREQYGAETAMLRAQNERLLTQLARVSSFEPWPMRVARGVKTIGAEGDGG